MDNRFQTVPKEIRSQAKAQIANAGSLGGRAQFYFMGIVFADEDSYNCFIRKKKRKDKKKKRKNKKSFKEQNEYRLRRPKANRPHPRRVLARH